MAAFAVNKVTQSLQSSRILKTALVILLFIIVFIDLSPGITSFPNYSLSTPIFREAFEQLKSNEKIMATQMWLSFWGSPFSKSDFIIITEENTNPEYATFVRGLNDRSTVTENLNRFYLLGVAQYIDFDYDNIVFKKVDWITAHAFSPSKTILIGYKNLTEAELIFEDMIKQEWFSPQKIGLILARQYVKENEADFVLIPQKTKPNEITVEDLPPLFASTQPGKELPWGKDAQSNVHVLVNESGWVFVSQMWYPHWRVNGKPVQEAGGGLIAFYADAPGEYKIYWERPWYDYVFWAISLITLLGLLYATIKPEFCQKLLEKFTAKNSGI